MLERGGLERVAQSASRTLRRHETACCVLRTALILRYYAGKLDEPPSALDATRRSACVAYVFREGVWPLRNCDHARRG